MGTSHWVGNYQLEICASSPTSAIAAQQGGANRIELCQSLESGGITPSHAQIMLARDALTIGIFVLIRPRSGNFMYTDLEIQEMIKDIQFCEEVGCDGVVVGVLNADGAVDIARMKQLIAAAGTMEVVFHRAFDLTKDPFQAMEDIIQLGCIRILTSGLAATAYAGKVLLRDLIKRAANRIEIMPGAGVDKSNLLEILSFTHARSIHSSAKVTLPSASRFINPDIQGMNEPQILTSAEHVASLADVLLRISRSEQDVG